MKEIDFDTHIEGKHRYEREIPTVTLLDDNVPIAACLKKNFLLQDFYGFSDLFPEEGGIAVSYNSGKYYCMFCEHGLLKNFNINNEDHTCFIPSLVWMLEIDLKNNQQNFSIFLCEQYPFEADAMTYHIPIPGQVDGIYPDKSNLSRSNTWRKVCNDYQKLYNDFTYSGEITKQFINWEMQSLSDITLIFSNMKNYFHPYKPIREVLPPNEHIVTKEDIFKRMETYIIENNILKS